MDTNNPFQNVEPVVYDNFGLRTPQREAYIELEKFAEDNESSEREVGIILPVGCGKSGCIALAPFALKSTRALVVAPGLAIAKQLFDDFDPATDDMFYKKTNTLAEGPFPEPVEIRGTKTNIGDLEEAHVVITNIQQLTGEDNRWLQNLSDDFFDLILFDEGHHNVAASWEILRIKFPQARIINFSATPARADGQLMSGKPIYSYPIFRAIEEGYVKQLKALVLNPRTLRYVRRDDGKEIEVSLDEVRRLGEEDADFRRSIVSSQESLSTIVDASIRELNKLRTENSDYRLKIIASALNYDHCIQVVQAYKERGFRADYVHSREDGVANQRVMEKLKNHELDVIVQVRKLGEGFDHPHLTVAAVFSIFSNLSPFIQFVGRIMRVIKQNAPNDPINRGVVIFHAGANVAARWEDFQKYSEADQEYFNQLLPMEDFDLGANEECEVIPRSSKRLQNPVEIKEQGSVHLQEIPLIQNDPEAISAIKVLKEKGYTIDEIFNAFEELKPVPVTKARKRQAMRQSLDLRIKTEAARILQERRVNPGGLELDKRRLGRTNLIVLKSAIDRQVNALVGKSSGTRHKFTRPELEKIDDVFVGLLDVAIKEVFYAS